MIVAGVLLASVGALDALRAVLPGRRRWVAPLVVLAALIAFAASADAWQAAALAAVAMTAWMLSVPAVGSGRAGFWPAVVLAVVAGAAIAVLPRGAGGGALGAAWSVTSPVGPVSFDEGVLVIGVVLFLLESANAVVRVALAQEGVPAASDPSDAAPATPPELSTERAPDDGAEPLADDAVASRPVDAAPVDAAPASVLKGGRLIGPIERLIVFSLTLAAAYPLLAAFIAAKGIVRFPEISRDSAVGNRAEYFLIGSLVSWLQGLAGAFAVWWVLAS